MQMIAICDKSNSNQWMFLAMLSTGLKKKNQNEQYFFLDSVIQAG